MSDVPDVDSVVADEGYLPRGISPRGTGRLNKTLSPSPFVPDRYLLISGLSCSAGAAGAFFSPSGAWVCNMVVKG